MTAGCDGCLRREATARIASPSPTALASFALPTVVTSARLRTTSHLKRMVKYNHLLMLKQLIVMIISTKNTIFQTISFVLAV